MDYSTTPKIYLKAPSQARKTSGESHSPHISQNAKPKVSVFSQFLSATSANSGGSPFKIAGSQAPSSHHELGHAPLTRPPSRAQHHGAPIKATPRYSYGPSSTSASIAATINEKRRVSRPMPTITYGPRAPQSHAAIEYNYPSQHNHGTHPENTLSVRPKAAGLSVYHGHRPKVPQDFEVNPKARIPHAPTVPAQSKFIQSSGLKIRREYAGKSDNKSPLAIMPSTSPNAESSFTSSSRNLSSSPPGYAKPIARRTSSAEGPFYLAKAPSSKSGSRSPSPTPGTSTTSTESKSKSFYGTSFINPNSFSLSLSSRQSKAPVHYNDNDDDGDYDDDDENDLSDPDFDRFLIKPSNTIPEEPENTLDETDDNFSQPTPEEPKSISDLHVKQARSDRKIQDLEISNASLMAVNKYLEKRLRTQSKDLQYLKTNTSIELTRFDSDSDDEKEGDDAEEDEATNENDENLSPEEKELATKTKMIEKRMQSHIEFLESSEKINTMMRNCLLLSETLIQEASKSMEYEVDSLDPKYGLHLANHDFINSSDEIILPDEPVQEEVAA